MGITVSGTAITFNDGTTQSTAATVPTTLYAVGTYVIGRPYNNTVYSVNSTLAGSSLYATPPGSYWNGGSIIDGITGAFPVATLVNVGTWRCVSPTGTSGSNASVGLWVRIS